MLYSFILRRGYKMKLKQAIIVRTDLEMGKGTLKLFMLLFEPQKTSYCICQNGIMNGFMD